jgi:hypothetical protein
VRLRDERIEFVNVEGEVVALDTAESLYYSVNETGVKLWIALRDGTTEQALQRLLVEEHGISEEKAAADVTAFLGELAAAGLLDEA